MSKVIKVGNSHAIVLPVPIFKGLNLGRGDYMVFAVYDNHILTARKLSEKEIVEMQPEEVFD